MSTATERPEKAPISRIVVAFAGSEGRRPLTDVASLLARALSAELTGVYIRDARLSELAALPFLTAVRPGRRARERVTPGAVEAMWRREAALCEEALSGAASALRLAWSFSTVSGEPGRYLSEAAGRRDLIALAVTPRDVGTRNLLARVREATRGAPAALLMAAERARAREDRRRSPGPVLAIDDGDKAGAETVALAARIAEANGRDLAVLAIGDVAHQQDIARRAQEIAGPRKVALHQLPDWTGESLARVVGRIAPSLVVADLVNPDQSEEQLMNRLTVSLDAPLVLLRPPEKDD